MAEIYIYIFSADTRSNSHVTVAAQQRAEAAYRRQRMAQERAEETAIWRAEMEVERARMLKELSGEGSRRPSYCLELQESRKEAPDECNVFFLYLSYKIYLNYSICCLHR